MAIDDTRNIVPSSAVDDDINSYDEPVPMDEDMFQSVCEDLLNDAVDFIEDDIAPSQNRARRYYRGESDLTPLANNSKQVTTEVRDVVEGMMPSLMEIFTSSGDIVDYEASRPGTEAYAKQATKLGNHIYWKDNPGWTNTYWFLKNALIEKLGIFKVCREEAEYFDEETYNAVLTPEQYNALLSLPDVAEVRDVSPAPNGMVSATIVRVDKAPKIKIEVIRPENFVINRSAQGAHDYSVIGEDSYWTVSDVMALGYSYDQIEEAGIENQEGSDHEEARQNRTGYNQDDEDVTKDPSMQKVSVADIFIWIDEDGDGIAELHHVLMVGSSRTVFENEIVDDHWFAFASPYMFGNSAVGQSVADTTMDFQDVTTALTRGILDNTYDVVNPQKGINDKKASLPDLIHNRNRGYVRAVDPNAVWNIETPYVGDKTLNVMAWFDRKKQERTGVNAASQGLDAETLQSSSVRGVDKILSVSQEKIQLIAALCANVAFVRLFTILNRLMVRYSDRRSIEVNGQWVVVDPRPWSADFLVTPNVGLGFNKQEKKIEALSAVREIQENIMAKMGLMNPWVSAAQYANTLNDLVAATGVSNPLRYFSDAARAQAASEQIIKAQQSKPDPEMLKVQLQQQKLQTDTQLKDQKQKMDAQLKAQDQQTDTQLEIRQQDMDAALKQRELAQEAELKFLEIMRDTQLKEFELGAEFALEQKKIEVNAEVDTRLRSPVGNA